MHASPAIKLSVLTSRIQQALATVFEEQTYWVMADVTSYSYYAQKGYHYFDLVEKDTQAGGMVAKVSGVAWGNGATRIKEFEIVTGQMFRNDIHVLVKVSVSYHPVHGLRITLLDIDTSFTIGLLEQQKQQTLARLLTECADFIRKAGDRYITRNNQLPLPPVIQRIAVVTSNNSAGYQDFLHTLEHNHFGYTFQVEGYFTVVQGEAKAELIQQQLINIYQSGKTYDVVVMIRGGGAQTDFLIFDTFILGRAVAKFPVPVLTGIGHQKNETITDLMAHTATKTPTRVAELIIAHNRAFEESVTNLQQMILIRSQQLCAAHFQALSFLNASVINQARTLVASHKEELNNFNQVILHTASATLSQHQRRLMTLSGMVLSKPRALVAGRLQDLDHQAGRLRSFSRMFLQNKAAQLAHYDTLFKIMSPDNILKRGFAMISLDGKILRDAQTLSPGSQVQIHLQDALLDATITAKNNTHEPGANI
ncbi:exodeoxyribonuclease VII large subunit [Chitinophaga nivalis]|uniref:Exodeoxyribonuclease 7 large subunit n=1 Tax=Chitinophaga nivalis TaxID=2991709 RepID=A0ABT3IP45_9BACT|nr:exodeoxyribonuclease VII large subunit [Chitinophaga nivalis]MCW3464596.1 exodeoxyribonuclease VII large subunit [Chitinophaga nivalis]MCW3485713.1 exodeoxyribonuclease VII large subunit [Chitinophaga nivalis]